MAELGSSFGSAFWPTVTGATLLAETENEPALAATSVVNVPSRRPAYASNFSTAALVVRVSPQPRCQLYVFVFAAAAAVRPTTSGSPAGVLVAPPSSDRRAVP